MVAPRSGRFGQQLSMLFIIKVTGHGQLTAKGIEGDSHGKHRSAN